MKKTRELKIAKKYLAGMSTEEIVAKAYRGNLTSVKGIGVNRANIIIEELIDSGLLPDEDEFSRNARNFYAVISGMKLDTFLEKYGFNEIYTQERILQLIELLGSIMSIRELKVIQAIYGLNQHLCTIEEYAYRLNTTVEYVYQILAEALKKCMRHKIAIDLWYTNQEGAEDVLDNGVEVLNLNNYAFHCLKRAKCNTIKELINLTETELRLIHGVGKKNYNEIIERLNSLGLSLKKQEKMEVKFKRKKIEFYLVKDDLRKKIADYAMVPECKIRTDGAVMYNSGTNTVTVDMRATDSYIKYAAIYECICHGEYRYLAPKTNDPNKRCGLVDKMIIETMPEFERKAYISKRIEMFKTLIKCRLDPSMRPIFEESIKILESIKPSQKPNL